MNQTEYSIFEILKIILKEWRVFALMCSIGITLGIVIAISSPKFYKVSTRILPEYSSGSSGLQGSLGSLAGLAGVNLKGNSSNDALFPPSLYSEPINSVNFYLHVKNEKYYLENIQDSISLDDYYDVIYEKTILERIRLPFIFIRGLFSKRSSKSQGDATTSLNTIKLTEAEQKQWESFMDGISVRFDDELGVVEVETNFQNSIFTAKINESILDYLKAYVADVNSSKQLRKLNFLKSRLNNAKYQFDSIQNVLANYEDSNRNIVLGKVSIQLRNIQFNYDLYYGIYKTIMEQYENSKIEYEDNLNAFNVLKPVQIPSKPDKPSKSLIVLLAFLLSIFAALSMIYFKYNIKPEIKRHF